MGLRKKRPGLLALLILALALWLGGCGGASGLQDGTYAVDLRLEGGSGRAEVLSPAQLEVEQGRMTLTLVWTSANYDYMLLDGQKYTPLSLEPGSTFRLPVERLGAPMEVAANTTAMSTPHEIQYTLTVFAPGEHPETAAPAEPETAAESADTLRRQLEEVLVYDHSMELEYAQGFAVDCYQGGYCLLTIPGDGRSCLVVPEGQPVPSGLPESLTLLCQPLDRIYLAASSVMDLFLSLDALDAVAFTGTRQDSWHLPRVREAMAQGRLAYGGSYSTPDYERICAAGCSLAIESTMIYHAPEVRQQLERFGVPVLVDRSSYEPSPLGRVEWIKLYGLLTGREHEAQRAFDAQKAAFAALEQQPATGKTVVFFYLPSGGGVNVRRAGDYIPQLIRMAGGCYLPQPGGEESGSGTFSMEMEAFYALAKQADYLIYNSTIEGELDTLEALLARAPLLANCRAVQQGQVFCTTQDLYQSSMALGDFAQDLAGMLAGQRRGLCYLYPLE